MPLTPMPKGEMYENFQQPRNPAPLDFASNVSTRGTEDINDCQT
jgi:hypothetical protein